MGARRSFRRGASLKRPPIKSKMAPTWWKSNKTAPQIAKKIIFQWEGGGDRLLPPPPAGAHRGGIATFSPCGFLFATFFSKWRERLFCPYRGWGAFLGLPPPLQTIFKHLPPSFYKSWPLTCKQYLISPNVSILLHNNYKPWPLTCH